MVLIPLLACRVQKDSGQPDDIPVDSAQESSPTFDSPAYDSPAESASSPDSEESVPPPVDADGDGYADGEDCDDSDASRHPGADEGCDQVDNDCDGENTLCSDSMADVTITTARDVDGFGGYVEFAGDVDGDGRSDLLISDYGNYCCSPLIGPAQVLVRAQDLSPGDLQEEAVRWTYAYGRELYPMGDIDADGRADLLVLGARDGTAGVGLVTDIDEVTGDLDEGALAAWWSAAWDDASGVGYVAWATGDVDGDGQPEFDLVEPHGATYLISTGVFRTGAALLDDAIVVDADGYSRTSLGDLDGDGLADLTLGSTDSQVWFYSGAGLVPGTTYTAVDADREYTVASEHGYLQSAGVLSDLDGDGLGELGAAATYKAWILAPTIAATLDDAFASVTSSAAHSVLDLAEAGDQDGDGANDLLVVAYNWDDWDDGALGLWSGPDVRGSLSFEAGAAFWLWSDAVRFGGYTLPSTTGDLDGDGQLDLLFGNPGEKEAYVMYGPLVE